MRNINWLSDLFGLWRAGRGKRAAFLACAAFTFLLLTAVGVAGVWLAKDGARSSPAMQRFAASVVRPFFLDMMSLEVPHLSEARQGGSIFAGKRVIGYLTGLWLQVNPSEPRSLLAGELRGLPQGGAQGPRTGAGGPAGTAGGGGGFPPSPTPQATPAPSETPANTATPTPAPTATATATATPAVTPASGLTTNGRKAVLIYHSHPRESWVPELQAGTVADAESADKNITQVGRRLAEQLEKAGIGTIHSGTDYKTTVPDYNWNFSYKYSQQTVQEAFAANDRLTFLFDIHRDSAARKITTATIGGADYAKVYFIVGKKNEHWEQNEAFAKKMHDRLEAEYPGLSRGILDKAAGGHGEYNQSLSPNSMLLEIGGAYNTLEECNRTADILAKVIGDLYWDAEKVNGSVSIGKNRQAGPTGG